MKNKYFNKYLPKGKWLKSKTRRYLRARTSLSTCFFMNVLLEHKSPEEDTGDLIECTDVASTAFPPVPRCCQICLSAIVTDFNVNPIVCKTQFAIHNLENMNFSDSKFRQLESC